MGEAANRAKSGIEGAVAARLAALDEAELSADLGRVVDVTLPARGRALGTLQCCFERQIPRRRVAGDTTPVLTSGC